MRRCDCVLVWVQNSIVANSTKGEVIPCRLEGRRASSTCSHAEADDVGLTILTSLILTRLGDGSAGRCGPIALCSHITLSWSTYSQIFIHGGVGAGVALCRSKDKAHFLSKKAMLRLCKRLEVRLRQRNRNQVCRTALEIKLSTKFQ